MKTKLVTGVIALGLSLSAVADQEYTPYLGAEAKWNQMELKKAEGGNLTQKNYPQANVFGGLKFNECLAIEAGYESSSYKKKTATVQPGGNFFGNVVAPASAAVTANTKTKLSGFHINLVGLYPLFDEFQTSLFGSIGLAQLKFRSNVKFTFAGDPTVNSRDFAKRKIVPRVTVGIQHMLNENVGVRAALAWEKTSSFKKIYAKNSTLFMNPKDSKSIGLGVFYNFK